MPDRAVPHLTGVAPAPPMAMMPLGPLRPPMFWPEPPAPIGRPAVVGVLVALVVAAVAFYPLSNGPGWLVIGIALAALATIRKPRGWSRIGWSLAAVALLAVPLIRDSGQLLLFCVAGAFACGAVGAAGGRHLRAMAAAAILVVPAGIAALPWWAGGVRTGAAGRSLVRPALTAAVVVGLVLVFGGLFTAADPAFADLVRTGTPTLRSGDLGRVILAVLLVLPVATGVAYLTHGRSRLDRLSESRFPGVRRHEWAVPVAVLDMLFLTFVGVQIEVLFGGRDRVLRTAGLTYADYARSGFWQLLIVAGLTVAVITAGLKMAPKATRTDRVLVRTLLGTLALLTLVIVASAMHRMSVYDQAYGFTRLRLAVFVIEAWLGVVFLLILAAGLRLNGAWVPRAGLAAGVLALLVVAAVNPDRFIADHNVERFERTGRIDMTYLCELSADAVPALIRLPEPVRRRSSVPYGPGFSDGWRSWDLGRATARNALDEAGPGGAIACWPANRLVS